MNKDITEAMNIIKDTINELSEENMKAIVGEIKEIVNKTVNKLNNSNVKKNNSFKGGNVQIIVGEIKDIMKESIGEFKKEMESKDVDCCCPFIICFVLKDAECVNIYNGACETWDPGDCKGEL